MNSHRDPSMLICMIPVLFWIVVWISTVSKNNDAKRRGYRHRVWHDGESYDPDPTQKETLRNYWEGKGYRWSDRYQRWYLPKSERELTLTQRVARAKRRAKIE